MSTSLQAVTCRRTAVIFNAVDFKSNTDRAADYAAEAERLKSIGLEPTEIDRRHYFAWLVVFWDLNTRMRSMSGAKMSSGRFCSLERSVAGQATQSLIRQEMSKSIADATQVITLKL